MLTACLRTSTRGHLDYIGVNLEALTATVQWTHTAQVSSDSGECGGTDEVNSNQEQCAAADGPRFLEEHVGVS